MYSNELRLNRLLAVCYRCKYEWISRVEDIRTCAKCRSPYWNKAKTDGEYYNMQTFALRIVSISRKEGLLADPKTLKCMDCGKNAKYWEHRNYARPLLVDPICQKCNIKRGKSINSI